MTRMTRAAAVLVLAAAAPAGASFLGPFPIARLAAPVVPPSRACLPSCSAVDGRFLAITKLNDLESLSSQKLNFEVSVQAGDGLPSTFDLGVFDGDTGDSDLNGEDHWDIPPQAAGELLFTLFADPTKDGTGTFQVFQVSGSSLRDNAWDDFTISNVPQAQSGSGNFFYRLEVELLNPTNGTISAFKIRTTSPPTTTISVQIFQQPFAYIAMLGSLNDARIVYPGLSDADIFNIVQNKQAAPQGPPGSTYDGSFEFVLNFSSSQDFLTLFDGDFDRGDAAHPDTDDSNTANDEQAEPFAGIAAEGSFPGVGPWALPETLCVGPSPDPGCATTPTARFETAQGLGGPADDRFENIFRRSPSIAYEIVAPDDRRFVNDNPSGNREWERFRVQRIGINDTCDTTLADVCTHEILPPGSYTVRLEGLDMQNLNFFFFLRVDCVQENGEPCDSPPLFLLGDTVFEDDDGDGTQDPPDDPGIPGVVLELLDGNGFLLGRQLTDGDGLYLFEVEAGTYTVRVAPENFGPAAPRGALGDFVWLDGDGDGFQDGGEPGLPDVEVLLFEAGADLAPGGGDDVFLGATRTDVNGLYRFDNLLPGTYYTGVKDDTLPDGLTISGGSDPSAVRTVTGSEVHLDLDFGYTPADAGKATVGDLVWHDLDGDGVLDAGEPGLDGITVELIDTGSGTTAGLTTTAGGFYLFTGLAPGSYEVRVTDTAGNLTGFSQTADPDEVGACTVCDARSSTTLAAGQVDLSRDFGYRTLAVTSITDRVWRDDNRNGVFDGGESGIEGVTVSLRSIGGKSLATAVTGPTGHFSFFGLPAGFFEVVITDLDGELSGMLPTTGEATALGFVFEIVATPLLGASFGFSGEGALSGLLATTASPQQTHVVPDAQGGNVLTYDFGYRFGSIGDRVWYDADGDGVQDAGEPGLVGVTVRLRDASGAVVESTVTGADGIYSFDRVRSGSYTVEVEAPTLPPGLAQTFDLDGLATPDAASLGLSAGQDRDDLDFGYRAICALSVDKTCQVVPEPEPFVCSDAKPLDLVSMVWDGLQTVRVKAWKGNVGSTLLADVDPVAPGQEVEVTGYQGSPNDVIWEVFLSGTGTPLGESKFHLSCSDSQMNGVEDCGKRQGDGKGDDSGLINDWLLEGLGGSGQRLDCNPTPPPPAPLCETTGHPTPSCETGDPDTLTWRYTGGGCAASDHDQPGDKASCTESSPGIDGGLPVTVEDDGKGVFFLDPGEEFTTRRRDSAVLTLTQVGASETHQIHVSCSQPLAAGDVFGSLTLTALDGRRAGVEVIYNYGVANGGAPLNGVVLFDDKLGQVAGPLDLAMGEMQSFSVSTRLEEDTVNQVDATGFAIFDTLCEASDQATVRVAEPCFPCEGGTTDITFEYLGAAAGEVIVYDDRSPKVDEILFRGTVQPGEEFSVTKRPGQARLDNNISLFIDGVKNTEVHTSCSQPIGPGLVRGEFEITEARSRLGGRMCPLEACEPDGSAALEFKGREIKWDLANLGDVDLVIERITVSWPAANGDLDEIKRAGDVIHKGNFAPTSAVIDSGWEGDAGKRTIDIGATDTLKLKFVHDASTTGAYEITVEFDQGCSVSKSYDGPPAGGGTLECSKPIDALTMLWDGGQAVRVKAWKGPPGSALLADLDGIPAGGGAGSASEVTVSGYAGSPNDVVWEVFAAGTSTPLGESEFHLSCSDDEMDGAEDCGSRQGNGKSNDAGLINDWIFEGLVDSDETLDCTP